MKLLQSISKFLFRILICLIFLEELIIDSAMMGRYMLMRVWVSRHETTRKDSHPRYGINGINLKQNLGKTFFFYQGGVD